ncbi:MAG: hypothetical protein JXP34_23935 [Planctomycetes bacterium]|nr:hypothetical protein [Planctomycetota bacterium]
MLRSFPSSPWVRFLPVVVAACALGTGCARKSSHKVVLVANPAVDDLVGIWTGTFTDQFGDYVVSVEIGANATIPDGSAATAFVIWGGESMGLLIGGGTFTEVDPGYYEFEYDTYDPVDYSYRDTVSGDLFLVAVGSAEGSFSTTSGTFGQCSLGITAGFSKSHMEGHFAMAFSDPDTRELWYLGEVVYDTDAEVVPGATSYLTDDLEGEIDPGANVWPILDGYLTLIDAEVGYFEGELFFADVQDTIALGGYLGADFGVFAGIFEDIQGAGLFTFVPVP